jgi:hypothetical protein
MGPSNRQSRQESTMTPDHSADAGANMVALEGDTVTLEAHIARVAETGDVGFATPSRYLADECSD